MPLMTERFGVFPAPPFLHMDYPMKPVVASSGAEWAVGLLGNSAWTVTDGQGSFNPTDGCMDSQEEFEGLQTVMAAGPTQMLNCISYVCVSGPGAPEVDVAAYPSTTKGATKYEGWQGTEFGEGPAVGVAGYYWYRLAVEWESPANDPEQDPSSVVYAKTYRHQGDGHAQPFKLWAFRHDLANLTKWYGSYVTDTEWWGQFFSPLVIGIDSTVTLKGQPMWFHYDAATHSLSIPQQPWDADDPKGDGIFYGATVHLEATDAAVAFSGSLQPRAQDGRVGYTGTAPPTTQIKLTSEQLTAIAASYSIPITAAEITQLADALPTFPPPAHTDRTPKRRLAEDSADEWLPWTPAAFLGAIAGGVVGGIFGIVGGPVGIVALAGAGAAAGASIGAGLTYQTPANEVIAGIEMESTHGCCVDVRGQSYPVGWIPWALDVARWRSYDPTTIDGVGILVGVRTGLDGSKELIGRQLMTRTEEVLKDRGDGGHYSWVFSPDQAIIYRWNSGAALRAKSYIRHSQLGGGQSVICAGEFHLNDNAFDIMIAIVNDSSGHYKPDGGKCMGPVLTKLETMGVDTTKIKVSTATEIIN